MLTKCQLKASDSFLPQNQLYFCKDEKVVTNE